MIENSGANLDQVRDRYNSGGVMLKDLKSPHSGSRPFSPLVLESRLPESPDERRMILRSNQTAAPKIQAMFRIHKLIEHKMAQ